MVKKRVPVHRPPHRSWERRPEERPREILAAALQVFAERGYRATRLADVAAAAGVTKGTIYYYFKNKDALLMRLAEAGDRERYARLEAIVTDTTGPVSTQIRMVLRKGFAEPGDTAHRQLRMLYLTLHADAPRLFARAVQRSLVDGWALLVKLIQRGQASGEFRRDVDGPVAARIFTSGLLLQQLWRSALGLESLDPFDKDRMVDSTIELFLHSLRPTVRMTTAGGGRKAKAS